MAGTAVGLAAHQLQRQLRPGSLDRDEQRPVIVRFAKWSVTQRFAPEGHRPGNIADSPNDRSDPDHFPPLTPSAARRKACADKPASTTAKTDDRPTPRTKV